MYEDRDARAPASMHSEKGSRNTVKGTMAKRSFVHLAMINWYGLRWKNVAVFRENSITFKARILRQNSDQNLWREFQRTLACLVAWLETTDNTDHLSDWWSQSLSSCLQINHKNKCLFCKSLKSAIALSSVYWYEETKLNNGPIKTVSLEGKQFPLMSL